ncbi:MAG: hypothetical protein AAGK14_04440 [Verrucomicrobiota bacterium]
MEVRVRHEGPDALVIVIIDLEDFSTSSPHRDLTLSGNLNDWRVNEDELRFPWADGDSGEGRRNFLPLRVPVPRRLDALEFKLWDSVKEEWLEPYGYLQGAYSRMEPYLKRNELGSLNVCIPLS